MEKTTRKIDEHTASWYIVYTAAKAENKVKKMLEQSGFETYLPQHFVVRIWNSRIKKVMVPIIPRIVFAYLSKNDIEEMVSFNKEAFLLHEKERYVSISAEQMKMLCDMIEQANGGVGFTSESVDTEIVIDEQLSKSNGKIDVQRCCTKFILPIKGLGTIWGKKSLEQNKKSK